ncbi:microcephalin isoform X2 [Synchiropus splendidus]|nr:microcephalin isoform X2 [Synchiropus splendidus]
MTTATNSSILKDVVAYVDVWSSEKTANCSKPFIQQLHEMGAQVSKTFSKRVTHVVFHSGHPTTWRKAKKSHVKLVSVLWVGRCYDDGVHVDEELFPAINNETNPVLKNKRHRCMQPKDSPERSPVYDKRMKRKLEKMMKDLPPKQVQVTEVSDIIIDEENGIIYSPALKRSDYMARRLKDMKEKHESLSPTASQMVESSSPPGLKPSLGSTPTGLRFLYNELDEDSGSSVAELAYSPDDAEVKVRLNECDLEDREPPLQKDLQKPWLSPCSAVPKRSSMSPVRVFDFNVSETEEAIGRRKSRRMSVRERPVDKSNVLFGSAAGDHKGMRQPKIRSMSPLVKKTVTKKATPVKCIKETCKTTDSFTEIQSLDDTKSIGLTQDSTRAGPSLPKAEEKHRESDGPSISALVPSGLFHTSSKASIGSKDSGDDDNVFEDFFSPVRKPKERLRLSTDEDIFFPFPLDSISKKRKVRRSESLAVEAGSKKRMRLEHGTGGDHCSKTEPNSPAEMELKMCPKASKTLTGKQRRQSTLPFISSTEATADNGTKTTSAPQKHHVAHALENHQLHLDRGSSVDAEEKVQLSKCQRSRHLDVSETEGGIGRRKSRRMSVRERPVDKSNVLFGSAAGDHKGMRQPKIRSMSPPVKKTVTKQRTPVKCIKGKSKTSDSYSETSLDIADSDGLESAVIDDDCLDAGPSLPKAEEKQSGGPSLSALVRSGLFHTSSKASKVSKDGGDDNNVFEDFFSPARKSKERPRLSTEEDILFPFQLDSISKKRKVRRSESFAVEAGSKRRMRLEHGTGGDNCSKTEPNSPAEMELKMCPKASKTLTGKQRRQSTLPFISSTEATADKGTEAAPAPQKHHVAHTLENNGSEAAAGSTEISCDAEENRQKMIHKSKRTLVMTSMPSEKQQVVVQLVKALGGFVIVDRVSDSTTHVVSGSDRRTLNILLGIARGCWILSYEWILWCLEHRKWIPEEPYELSEQFPAAQICRLQRHLSAGEHQQDLFHGQPAMYVSQQSQPPAKSLVELIQLCGGTVCKTVRQAGICIGKYSGRRPEGSRILSEQWVLDSITHLKQLSYDNYNLA